MATQAQAQLLQLIETLPAGENPYVAISQAFKEELFPAVPRGALYQLYVLAAAFGMYVRFPLAEGTRVGGGEEEKDDDGKRRFLSRCRGALRIPGRS